MDAPPRAKESCGRREEILEAATSLFAEQGFSDAVTQLLADRLGVGKGTIYRHFPSKRELFLAAADRVMGRLYEQLEASMEGADDPLDRIANAARTYLEFFAAHPEFVELLIQERAQFRDRSTPTFFQHRERSVRRWQATYRDLMEAGRVRPMPVERITDMFAAALYGSIFLGTFGLRSGSAAAQADAILDVIFGGILTDAERARRSRRASPGGQGAHDR